MIFAAFADDASGWPGIWSVILSELLAMAIPGIDKSPHNGNNSNPPTSETMDRASALLAPV